VFLDTIAQLLELPKLRVLEVDVAPDWLTIRAEPVATTAACPLCQSVSQRVHSGYERTVLDLAWGVRTITLKLEVRRFFCDFQTCARKIFTERLPEVVAPSARRTTRLRQMLEALAFELGGEAGAAVAQWLQCGSPSADTLLRLIRRAPPVLPPTPRCLGVDDWALKKGHTYGTLLCDLERHQVIELLEGREGETLAKWLKEHPGVEIISRDRASAYAEGAKEGAPGAIQVADRFHLLQNLSKALRTLFEQQPQVLKLPPPATASKPADTPSTTAPSATALIEQAPTDTPLTPPTAAVALVSATLQQRQANYQAVQTLRQQGATLRSIAEQLQIDVNTANKYAQLPSPPAKQHRTTLKLIGYEAFFYQRWNAGERSPKVLFTELQQRGFRGSYQSVARYVAELRGPLPAEQAAAAPAAPPMKLTVTQAVRVLLLAPDQLTAEQQTHLDHLRQTSPLVERAYTLAHQFQTLVRERRSAEFPTWLEEAQASQVPGLIGFVGSLKKDLAAVTAGVSLPWSNGPTEGHVNRLKQIKRQMYGRGKLDLLKRRIMHRRTGPP
jgi:transposase